MAEISSQEIWAKIPNYQYYEISNYGNIRSLDRIVKRGWNGSYFRKGAPLKIIVNNAGYPTVTLSKDGICTIWLIHRLVALAFIPTIPDKKIINHKDANKQNNYYLNLEWCDHSHNLTHSYTTTRKSKKGKDNKKFGQTHTYVSSKIVLDLNTGIFYDNVGDAAMSKGIRREKLRWYLDGRSPNKTSFIYA